MNWKCEEVQDRILRPAADNQAFRLHLAALDWSLVDPIVINGPEDIKATNWRERGLKPFHHQVQNLITFCRRLPVALIADDVGLGKTISAGLILSELISRRKVTRALVLCPKVLSAQWVAELDEKFGLVAKDVTGKDLDAELHRSTPIVVTTYDSARTRLHKIEPGTFDMCILDEAHKLRNLYGSKNPPALAVRVKEALERRPFRYVLMLTATPIQNKVWDLYSLIDLLKVAEGKINPLGTPTEFSTQFIEPGSNGRRLRALQAATFRRLVRDCLSRTRRTDVKLSFPDRHVALERVPLQMAELDLIKIVGTNIEKLNPFQQVSIAQAMMSSPRALIAQAENMGRSGSLNEHAVADLRSASSRVNAPAKLVHLLKLLDHLRGQNPTTWRAVVFTVRRETQEMIGESLLARGIPYGFIRGGSAEANEKTISSYRKDPPRNHVIVSTDAGAEGVNLQAGNVLINYDLPWNPMIVEQRIGRVQRLGSEFDRVVILNLVGAGTVEDRIVARLTEKLQGVAQAIGDIEGILEAADINEEGEESFEARVRKMVVQALKGQDVARAREVMEQNIEDARKLFESRRTELDNTLGNGGEPKPTDRPLPKIDRKPPRLGHREFVLDAKRADGLHISQVDQDTFEANGPGRVPERISFSDMLPERSGKGVFAAQSVRCFLPGKPAFERLVQHWVDHQSHRVADFTDSARVKGLELARIWCGRQPGCEFVGAEYTTDRTLFQGIATMKVRAGNGVDSFEKVLRGRFPLIPDHEALSPTEDVKRISLDIRVSDVLPQFQRSIQTAVEHDTEVAQFCDFYLDRLREAVAEAGGDNSRRSKVEGDFRPYVQTEVMGLEGSRYETGVTSVAYRADGVTYRSQLSVIPATGQILTAPTQARCVVTGASWPEDCLGVCEVTKERALKHRMALTSDGRNALPDQIVTCALSGNQILIAESGLSSISGKRVHRSLLRRCELTGGFALPDELEVSQVSASMARKDRMVVSQMSGRVGLPTESIVCKATNRTVLIDEVVQSVLTKDWYAKDQLVSSEMSGKSAPPPDLALCELSGSRVLLSEIEFCTISGKSVRRDRLAQSAQSYRWVLPDLAVKSDDGYWALPDEIGVCALRGRNMLTNELGSCILSGLIVDKRLLNTGGELIALRQLLDGKSCGEKLEDSERSWLRTQTGWEKLAIGNVVKIHFPVTDVAAVVAEERALFGLRVLHHGVMIKMGTKKAILSRAAVGIRRGGNWSSV